MLEYYKTMLSKVQAELTTLNESLSLYPDKSKYSTKYDFKQAVSNWYVLNGGRNRIKSISDQKQKLTYAIEHYKYKIVQEEDKIIQEQFKTMSASY